jgi:hypothetical protein
MIPEGTYLEMCDNLKQVHRNLPKPGENNSRRVPFMPHDPLDLAVRVIVIVMKMMSLGNPIGTRSGLKMNKVFDDFWMI